MSSAVSNSAVQPRGISESVTFTPVSMTAYTGGSAMGHQAFPTVRWRIGIGDHNWMYLNDPYSFVRISFYIVDATKLDAGGKPLIVGKFSFTKDELAAARNDPDTTYVIPELGASFYNIGDDAIDLERLFEEISGYDDLDDVPAGLKEQYLTLMEAITSGPAASDSEPGNYLIAPGYGLLFGGALGGSNYVIIGQLEVDDYTLEVGEYYDRDDSGSGAENKKAWTVGFSVYPSGYLVTRYVTDPARVLSGELDIATPVQYGPGASGESLAAAASPRATVPAAGASAFSAVIPEGSVIETNGDPALGVLGTVVDGGLVSAVEGGQNPQISLLADDLLPTDEGGSREDAVRSRAERWLADNGRGLERRSYQFKYLDLVNENDGNAWVSSSEGADVTWPYPEGTGDTTEFTLLQLPGMFREYGINGQAEIEAALAAAEPVEQRTENTADGIRFHVDTDGYGPFILTWQTPEEPAETPGEEPTGTPAATEGDLPATGDGAVAPAAALFAAGAALSGAAWLARRGGR